jgi:dienelactone hydrolase
VIDAEHLLRSQGHQVTVVDLLEGRTFDTYEPAMRYAWEDVGQAELLRRGLLGVQDLPDGFAALGFSLGCLTAAYVTTQRQVARTVMIAGAIPVSVLGEKWPANTPAQTHVMLDDPWRDQGEIDQTVRDVQASGSSIGVFDYSGSGHLFTDPGLPTEYDPVVTDEMWGHVLRFLDPRVAQ